MLLSYYQSLTTPLDGKGKYEAGAQGEGWTGGTEGYVKQGQDGQGRRGQEGR